MDGQRNLTEDVLSETALSVVVLESLLPVGGSELEDAGSGPRGKEAEEVAEIGPGLDFVDAKAGEQGDEGRVGLGTVLAADKHPVASAHSLPSELQLGDVVVRGQAAVFQKTLEGSFLVGGIADGFADGRLVEEEILFGVAPAEKRLDDRARLLLA